MLERPHPLVADADLLQRVVLRDSTALIELERRHQSSLYAQAYGILMDSTLAERVVREVFAQLWFAAERFVVRSSLWNWLRMMAKDLARAELMMHDSRFAKYSRIPRRLDEADPMAHPGFARARVGSGAESLAPAPADGAAELARIRYRQGESGGGDGTPRDACSR
jgi:DNA-directed RNA polymerase specialized sigma24 family protein